MMAPVPVPLEKLTLHYFPGSKIPDWLHNILATFLHPFIPYLATNYLDRFLSKRDILVIKELDFLEFGEGGDSVRLVFFQVRKTKSEKKKPPRPRRWARSRQ
ncbi:unnamed protein product [Prunus brigantina]